MERNSSPAPRNAVPRSIDRHISQGPARPGHKADVAGRKPPASVRERADFCSSFLAERGCLAPDKPARAKKDAAA
jgi:hypothetical protein